MGAHGGVPAGVDRAPLLVDHRLADGRDLEPRDPGGGVRQASQRVVRDVHRVDLGRLARGPAQERERAVVGEPAHAGYGGIVRRRCKRSHGVGAWGAPRVGGPEDHERVVHGIPGQIAPLEQHRQVRAVRRAQLGVGLNASVVRVTPEQRHADQVSDGDRGGRGGAARLGGCELSDGHAEDERASHRQRSRTPKNVVRPSRSVGMNPWS